VRALAETTTARFRFDEASLILRTVGAILEGEIKRSGGDLDSAIRIFEQAVVIEDELEYSEPEPLPFSARHWLGAALLESEQYVNAEQVYREELTDHPNNGWSLYGLKAALEGQGQSSLKAAADFSSSWNRSDVWINSSRF